ncbi:MAG: NAD(P)H-binding protein [Bacteroidota bacterium]
MSKTALLLGASGLVGNEVLKQLLEDNDVDSEFYFNKVRVYVRKPLSIVHPKLEQHVVNFDSLADNSSLISGDVVFCCMGTTIKVAGSKEAFIKVDYTYPLEFGMIAKQNGVDKFLLVSSIGADKGASNFYLKVKGDIEDALKQLQFKSLIILRPSMLLGSRKEFRIAELIGKVIMKTFSFLFIGKLKIYKAIEASSVAKAMIRLSKREESSSNNQSIILSDRIQEIAKS